MRISKKSRSFNYIMIMLFCQFFIFLIPLFCWQNVFATDTENFYFEKFDADYYLTKDAEGISHLKVVENLTAVFPVHQNKGICRMIPKTNSGGKNTTLESLSKSDIKLLRNGAPEPIYSIESSGKFFEVCTGDENYVSGEQTYTFEYSFTKTVTEFKEGDTEWQELYWNTNGTGWTQKFNSVTARVHLEDPSVWTNKTWCYVGKYGDSGQDRCTIEQISDDTIKFSAEGLVGGENLTFDLELKPGSFSIPEPPKSYAAIIIAISVVSICILSTIKPIKEFKKTASKRKFYKEYFIKPEYQPHPKYSLMSLYESYIGHKKDIKVALLLDMIMQGQIELIKGDKKIFGGYHWTIRINKPESLSEESKLLLRILADKKDGDFAAGTEFELKSHKATSSLASMGERFKSMGASHARADGLMEKEYKYSKITMSKHVLFTVLKIHFSIIGFLFIILITVAGTMESELLHYTMYDDNGHLVVFATESIIISVIVIIAKIIITAILKRKTETVKNHTNTGLEMSRYMDGLKLYIRMAEKDRLAFLQSVDGADVTKEGIVKLYEKLLPYAVIFGLEKSWMNELSEYCRIAEIQYMDVASMYEIDRACRIASSLSDRSVHYNPPSSSYSSSSYSGGSSFSGGGGGGFSGGGGGGGGGHGR